MIKLMFEKQKQFFIITIDNKVIKYWDKMQGKIWGTSLQYLPPDPDVKKKILMSRNRVPAHFIELFNIPKKEMEEFEKAKDDTELMEIVIRDCRKHLCTLIDTKFE